MLKAVRDISERYQFDASDLLCHVTFLKQKTSVTDAMVAEANASLARHQLSQLKGRPAPSQEWRVSYDADEAAQLLKEVQAVGKVVWQHYGTLWGKMTELVESRSSPTWGMPTERAIQFAVGLSTTNSTMPMGLAHLRKRVIEHIEEGTVTDTDGSTIDIDLIMNVVQHRLIYREMREVQLVEGKLYDLRWAAASQLPDHHVGVFRQAFIQLMTHFDAAVFDLARMALQTNFFGLVAAFGRREKISFERMGRFGDFDSLRDSLIEDRLKARYVRDLLFELRHFGVNLPDDGGSGNGFPRLIELVLRRNVHLHNRGVVDARYLELGRDGRPKWNLDNLAFGDMAVIDNDYFQQAYGLCGAYVQTLADWVESGAPGGTSQDKYSEDVGN